MTLINDQETCPYYISNLVSHQNFLIIVKTFILFCYLFFYMKDRAANTVVRVLTSFKSADVERAVKSLDAKNIDTLMKYIYRGFESPSDGSSAILLTWHEKVGFCSSVLND